MTKTRILQAFPAFLTAPEEVLEQLVARGHLARAKAGELLTMQGHSCQRFGLLLEGQVRIYKLGENGREVTLYRLEPGDCCILAASCILSGVPFPAFAVAETDCELLTVPPDALRRWMAEHDFWRSFLFGTLARRLSDVIEVVEEVAFRRVDVRLAEYLLAFGLGEVRRTHQEIAVDLGTSREVVSRILKDFERRGALTVTRGALRSIDPDRLRDIVTDPRRNGGYAEEKHRR
ncbi:MAG: Crp/Fnr family transcriptional regulator [Candidatus Eremiobacterota bacterium]